MFWVASLLALICNLQHVAIAADQTITNDVEPASTGDTRTHTNVAESAGTSDTAGTSSTDGSDGASKVNDAAPTIHEEEDYKRDVRNLSDEELIHLPEDADSPLYHAMMDEITRRAEEEERRLKGTIPEISAADAAEATAAAEAAAALKALELADEEERLKHLEEERLRAEEEARAFSPKEALLEDVEEEEFMLPSKYPEINVDTTHVSYVSNDNPESVRLSIEHSFFEGADQYELCINCIIDETGERVEVAVGEVETIREGESRFCEIGPACFLELVWRKGRHGFSFRAHTEEKGWTIWGPTLYFKIKFEVGRLTHVTHDEL